MTRHTPIPIRAAKRAIEEAGELYAKEIGLVPGGPINDLVMDLGGSIEFKDFVHDSLDTESVLVNGPDDFQIFIPTFTSPERDRFTIAHELAHFLLHYPEVQKAHHGAGHNDDPKMYARRYVEETDPDLRRAEWEANWFAAGLLMPRSPVLEAFDRYKGNVQTLAEVFNVTPKAMTVRLASLGKP